MQFINNFFFFFATYYIYFARGLEAHRLRSSKLSLRSRTLFSSAANSAPKSCEFANGFPKSPDPAPAGVVGALLLKDEARPMRFASGEVLCFFGETLAENDGRRPGALVGVETFAGPAGTQLRSTDRDMPSRRASA
jgi:hypothetical protein